MFLTPNPIAFSIFGMDIRWYALLITLGMVLGFYIAYKRCSKYGIDPEYLYDIFLVAIPLGVICARLYYVAFNWGYYSQNLILIPQMWNGGLAIHGGIIGGFIGIYIVCKKKKINILKLIDVVVPSLILAQAIGRWGNYFNMEAYGGQTDLPWAINVIDPVLGSIYVHPTFFYESIWNLGVFFLLIYVFEKRKKAHGELACWYLILYSIGRFFIEGLRTDSLMFFFLRMAQIVSIVSIIGGIIGIIYLRKKAMENDENIKVDDKGVPYTEEVQEIMSPEGQNDKS